MKTDPKTGRVLLDNLKGTELVNAFVIDGPKKVPNGGTKWLLKCKCVLSTVWWAWAETIKSRPWVKCKKCRNKSLSIIKTTHGGKGTKLYSIWRGMLARCYYKLHKSYSRYGGRGITVCDRWRTSFENFRDDMVDCPPGLTLGRKDNDGNYDPSNCEWQPKWKQEENKESNKFITHMGLTLHYSEWSRRTGINKVVIRDRANKGWPPEKILSKTDFRVDKG